MATSDNDAGERLVKQDLITNEELQQAREHEEKTGLPWYGSLIRSRKISFGALEDVLRYEFHSKARHDQHESLGNFLVETGDLTNTQLKEALAQQKRNGRLLGNILLENGFVTRDILTRALSRQHNLEYANANATPSDNESLNLLPKHLAHKYQVIPVELSGDRLTVLIDNPQATQKLQSLGLLLGLRMHPMLSAIDDLDAEIERRYRKLPDETRLAPKSAPRPASAPAAPAKKKSTAKATAPPKREAPVQTSKEPHPVAHEPDDYIDEEAKSERFDEIAKHAAGASVVKMVKTILEGAANSGATDIHLDPQDEETRGRYRIDGVLHDVMEVPENMVLAVSSRIKILADLDITNTRLPQDGHISMEIGEREFDVRVASLPTFLGERVVLRLLDQSSVLSGIRDLGMEEEDQTKFLRLIEQPYGMILVTGPTGSGKTTTLYSALNQKNVMTDSIVTLEDPVEYQLPGINQVSIDPDIGLTFANTLRASLRQDIDVLLVGEIRDAETARIATRAAMTGHLVFSTLHTNDAPEAIATLRNMDVPSYLISSALTGVIGQRLIRKICPECKKGFKPTASLLKSLGLPATTKKLYRGDGCDTCYGTGNLGRTGIFEVLEMTAEMRKLIGGDAGAEQLMKAAKLKTMSMRCRQKVKEGTVNPEEFLRAIRT